MPLIHKQSKVGEVFRGADGFLYEVVDPLKKRVRRVNSTSMNDFVLNTGIPPMDEKLAEQNTSILYHFLKDSYDYDEVTRSRGYVKVAGYKMKYESHGFKIVDDWNYGKMVNVNKYHNDFATPEAVLEMVQSSANRNIDIPEGQAERSKLGKSLSKKFKVVNDKKENAKMKSKKQAATEKKKADTDKVETKKKERAEKKIRAPKYIAPEREEPIGLTIKSPKKKPAGFPYHHTVELSYQIKGPSGRKIPKSCKVPEFLAKIVLSEMPKAMALIMKLATGEVPYTDVRDGEISLERRFVRDPFQHFDGKLLSNPPKPENLLNGCLEILRYHSIIPATEYVFDTKLKKNTEVRVYYPDSFTWYYGKVLDTDYGVEIRFEDGDLAHLLKHQTLEVL